MDYENNQDKSESQDSPEISDKHLLVHYSEMVDICPYLDHQQIDGISNSLIHEIDLDRQTQAKWIKDAEDVMKLCRLEKEVKNTPFPNAASIKLPMISIASSQFAARTYPELIQDGKVVKTQISGPSNPLIDLLSMGVATHMSHQLVGADNEWEICMDKLLLVIANIGHSFKKTYYDTVERKICHELCFYKDLIIRNDMCITALKDLRRITHRIHCHPNDLITGSRKGIYFDDNVQEVLNTYSDRYSSEECSLLECHCFLDLDEDGYQEPYIVTIHEQTRKVIRIYARFEKDDIELNSKKEVVKIEPCHYFTDYSFLPAPDGSFLSVGFGTLLLHMNESANTIMNQLVDAGKLANLQTGIIDGRIKLMGGQTQVEPGTFLRAKGVIGQELKAGIVPLNYKEPSSVLFQLLGMIIEAGKELTSSTDAIQGMQNATNVPATSMLAQIEQGMKLFSALQRRFWRSQKDDYQKIYKLNGKHLDEEDYIAVLGPEFRQLPNIYKTKALKVIPVADPNLSSDAQRLTQAQVIMSVAMQPGSMINQYEAQRRMLEAAKVPNIEALLPPEAANQPKAPDPKMLDMQNKAKHNDQKIQLQAQKQQLQQQEFAAKVAKMEAEITNLQASAVNLVALAKSADRQSNLAEYNAKLGAVKTQMDAVSQQHKQMTEAAVSTNELAIKKRQIDQDHERKMRELDQKQQGIDNAQTGSDNQGDDSDMAQSSDDDQVPPAT